MDRIQLNRRRLLQAAAAASALTAASAPGGTRPTAARGRQAELAPEETFLYGIGADPTNLDPHVSVDGSVILLDNAIYDGLVQLKPGEMAPGAPLEVEPALAESWEASVDGLTYTFKLRPDLKFADGTPLDAAAVKWSFDRMMAIEQSAASNIPQLQTTDAVDPTTVRMTLAEPFAYFLPALGIYAGAVINPKVMEFEQDGDMAQDHLANATMGSGPYTLTEWQRGQQLVSTPTRTGTGRRRPSSG
jgi:peptide/nickel transport system substrate-binding protein